jgi:hypothetical protein
MVRKIMAVIAGYVEMIAFVFISFSALYLILGDEGSFEPGTYEVSPVWMVMSIILGLIAAVLGGYVCTLVARSKKPAVVLAGIVWLLSIIMAIPSLGASEEERIKKRSADVSNHQAMQNAEQPVALLLLNPFIGALGVLAGSRLYKNKREEAT